MRKVLASFFIGSTTLLLIESDYKNLHIEHYHDGVLLYTSVGTPESMKERFQEKIQREITVLAVA